MTFVTIASAAWFCAAPAREEGEYALPQLGAAANAGTALVSRAVEEDEAPPAIAVFDDDDTSAPRDVLRAPDRDTGQRMVTAIRAFPSAAPRTGTRALDGDEDTAWVGASGVAQWRWGVRFRTPVHLAAIRAHFGGGVTMGIPTSYRWEARPARAGTNDCAVPPGERDEGYEPLPGAIDEPPAPTTPPTAATRPQPTHRSWFVDADACALRLVVNRTNGGPPIVREVFAFEGARDVLRDGVARDDGAAPGFEAAGAIDGTYAKRWAGAPGKGKWTLSVELPEVVEIDRVRLVLGFDATSRPRGPSPDVPGRRYGIAYGPARYALEATDDGRTWSPIATTPTNGDGKARPLRRRMITLAHPRPVRALRLVIDGATGPDGALDPMGMPVVREIAAYAADDARRVLPAPWILSVNANPQGQVHRTKWRELGNDTYYAKYLQLRFATLMPRLREDDRYARALGPKGELMQAPPGDAAGEVLEAIEGDDEQLDAKLLAESSPPPIAVLSGSNEWEYSNDTHPDPKKPDKWYWDPLPDAHHGGMGQLAGAVQRRVAPFLGFCGGAQLLALMEAKRGDATSPASDRETIDTVLRRTNGRAIRELAPKEDADFAWPGVTRTRVEIAFDPHDPIFFDVAGPDRPEDARRRTTHEMPESHVDVVRPDAFLPGGPLERFELIAKSEFCRPDVVPPSPLDPATPNPEGPGLCADVAEAFRAKDGRWPLIGTQFHPEQRDFQSAADGDPPEAVGDPRLFVGGAFEQIVDAYLAEEN